MNISFYYVVPNKQHNGVIYNEGIAVLSAIAKRHGALVSLQRIDLGDFRSGAYSIDSSATIHALSYASGQHRLASQLIATIRASCPDGIIAVGGIHATVDRQSVIDLPEVDLVVSGEGEKAFEILITQGLEGLGVAALPNLHLRGASVAPLGRVAFTDVNSLDFPDRTIFEKHLLARAPEFIFSRGCPHSCAYCANAFLNSTFGCAIRRKSPEYSIREIENARDILGFGDDITLTFHDDIFLTDNAWLKEFAALYTARFRNPFRCNSTAKAITEENTRILKEMNCSELWIGIETGNEELRRKVLGKNVSNETILKAFHLANRQGLKTVSFMMIGIPGETEASIRDSMRLNRDCEIFSTSIARFQPFPGTPAYDLARRENTIRPLTEEQLDLGVGVFGLKEGHLSYQELEYLAVLFYNASKRNWAQTFYLTLLKPLLVSPRWSRHFWGVFYRVVNTLFPEKNTISFVRSDSRRNRHK